MPDKIHQLMALDETYSKSNLTKGDSLVDVPQN
jgi:hypothetical protein